MFRSFNKVAKTVFKSQKNVKKFYSTKIVEVNSEYAPEAIGPYSQGVKAGNTLYISGCLGVVPKTGEFPSDKTTDQAVQALENMGKVLKAGGSNFDKVVKTTVLLTDMSDFQAVNEIYSKFFSGEIKPARACYAVKQLPKDAKVEIEAIAISDSE